MHVNDASRDEVLLLELGIPSWGVVIGYIVVVQPRPAQEGQLRQWTYLT